MSRVIVHISEVDITTNTGMGRVEHYWMKAFESAGYTFIHIGPKEVGKLSHIGLFPFKAYSFYKKLKLTPTAVIAHEPSAGPFVKRGFPCLIESHGVERRHWEGQLGGRIPLENNQSISLKTRCLFPLWRLRSCDRGLRFGDKLLLINHEDCQYVQAKYGRQLKDMYIFKNGFQPFSLPMHRQEQFTVLFNGSWIKRKGISVLVKAAELLKNQNKTIHYRLIGTGKSAEDVRSDWPSSLQSSLSIHPSFSFAEEIEYLSQASVFVLPSFFEGQPLSLIQAMAAGKCCITTNTCGQKDIIKHNETGFLFEPGEYHQLANQIAVCYDNHKLRLQIGFNAQNFIQFYNWETVSQNVLRFVEDSVS